MIYNIFLEFLDTFQNSIEFLFLESLKWQCLYRVSHIYNHCFYQLMQLNLPPISYPLYSMV
ncbi:hypothetical protein RB653_006103 [Dictyostelium firmibasis]|uniref:Uncharacterized protein n=1 Tax=Dictyostelium firmibasis TaxID=79012 RepID=A0AAN7YYS3_9MYCE